MARATQPAAGEKQLIRCILRGEGEREGDTYCVVCLADTDGEWLTAETSECICLGMFLCGINSLTDCVTHSPRSLTLLDDDN